MVFKETPNLDLEISMIDVSIITWGDQPLLLKNDLSLLLLMSKLVSLKNLKRFKACSMLNAAVADVHLCKSSFHLFTAATDVGKARIANLLFQISKKYLVL
ncbi:hypothetical protein Y1Q_0024515 [Alligator mississippiensis]|uniref:Uncharacterized protein n=1 Tax=Alligator mississippiensis TaxID=8496 RepID=A0A151NAU1_ALLMI|nr:hypothetical protein Y1Q_0024515 [Alligator mississippiensis]